MGHSAHKTSVLEDGAAAHALYDAAGGGQKGGVCHPDDQIPPGVSITDPLDLDAIGAGRAALGGGPYLGRAGGDLLREGDLPQLARKVGAGGAVDAILTVDADGADGVGAQKMPLQLAGASGSAHAASDDLAGDDLAAAQGDAFAGVAVADGVAQPRKNAKLFVREGQGAHPGRGVPHPHPGPPLSGGTVPHRGQSGQLLLAAADIYDLHGLSLGGVQCFLYGIVALGAGLPDADDPVAETQPRCLGRIRCAAAGLPDLGEPHDECPFGEHLDAEGGAADRHLGPLCHHGPDGLDGEPAAQRQGGLVAAHGPGAGDVLAPMAALRLDPLEAGER